MPTLSQPRRKTRSRSAIKKILADALRAKFPSDTVDISDGYQGNIHVLVVSRAFDRLSEQGKRNFLWRIIDSTDLTDDEKGLISLILPFSVAELK